MSRVLVPLALICATLALAGCTGSIRLGSSVYADTIVARLG